MHIDQLTTAPTAEPITTAEAKAHLRIYSSFTDDDTYIDSLIEAARQQAELYTNRQIMPATWKLLLPCFPSSNKIKIYKGIIASITHIKYYDDSNVLQTIDAANYESVIEDYFIYPYIVPVDNYSWPSTYDKQKAIEVQYIGGWADAASVPKQLKQAILIMVAEMYEIRQETLKGSYFISELAKNLLNPYRLTEF